MIDGVNYPGFSNIYTCYCNNGDYHSLPDINFELKNLNMQFDLAASNYLLLPYINYTRPVSLCLLAMDTTSEMRNGF